MSNTNRVLALFGAIVLTTGVFAAQPSATKTITVAKKQVKHDLYYSGTIEPLSTEAITSAENGTVKALHFQYGQHVTKNQLLFEVASRKFQSTFVTTLKAYLTAKQQFHDSQSKLASQQNLWKYGLISKNAYTAAQTTFYNDQIALLQAQEQLTTLLENHKSIKLNYQDLQLKDFSKLKSILGSQFNSDIKTYAPVSGVALIPDKNANQGLSNASGSSPNGPIVKGSAVQQNQAVLSIGDLSGATINININEVYVNKIKPGLKATISSVAFPGITLSGKVVSVGSQASSASNSNIPTFPVVVKIPKLTNAQRAVVRVGMSAKIGLEIVEPPQIVIPLSAVIQDNGQDYVNIKTASGVHKTAVQTGETTLNSVVVLSGLKQGDQVVLPH